MAQKITIAELDINTDAFLKAATDTKQVLDGLKQSQKDLTKTNEQGSQQYVKNEVAIKRLSTQYTEQKNVLVSLNTQNTDFAKTTAAITNATNKEITSIQGARNNNKELLKVRNQLNVSTKAGQKALVDINGKLDSNNKFIKENVSGYEKQKINIGNYEGALRSVFPQMNGVLNVLKTTKTALDAQKVAQTGATTATNLGSKSLKVFKIALISTGIGAIVVAFGSLITFLTSTQRGMDAVTSVTRPLAAVFQSLFGVVQDLGGAMFDAFTNPKEAISNLWEFIKTNLVNRIVGVGDQFKALGKIISSGFTDGYEDFANASLKIATGVEDVIGKTKTAASETGKFFAEAAAKGAEIDKLTKSIEQSEAEIILTRSNSAKQLRELQLLANDRTLGAKANNDAADKALVIANDLATAEKNIINQKIKREEIEQSLNDSGREDLTTLNTLKAEANAADEKARATELKFLTARAGLVKEQRAATLKGIEEKKKQDEVDAAEKVADEEIELQRLANFEDRKRELENQIALENAATQEEKDLLKIEQDFEKETLALEKLQLDENQKTELLALLTTQRGQVLQDIQDKLNESALAKQAIVNKKEIDADKKQADARVDISQVLTGILTGLLGDSLAAKIASIAVEAAINAGLVSINTAAAQATNLAQATATAPPPFNFPSIIAAGVQNVTMQAASTSAISKIVSSAALQSVGTIASSAFYEGGSVPYGTGGTISGSNIPTQKGGDNILATVKSGEVILNEDQQARAGGSAFFNSIGVPGFATGGIATSSSITQPIQQSNLNQDSFNVLIDKINAIKVVAIESDITDSQNLQTEIIQGATI